MAFMIIVGLLLLVALAGAVYAIWTDVSEEEHDEHVASHTRETK